MFFLIFLLLNVFKFSFGEEMKNSLLHALHTHLQHDESMDLKLLLWKNYIAFEEENRHETTL